jgi:hypothetical protein
MRLGLPDRIETGSGVARRATVASATAFVLAFTMVAGTARADEPVYAPPNVEVAPGVLVVEQGAARPAAAGPRVITDYEEGDPVPAGYHAAQRTRKGLLIGGAVTFGCFYFISLLVAAASTDAAKADNRSSEVDALYIPAIGPFVQMARTSSATANVFLALDGIAQAGGVAMFVAGISMPKTVLVRDASTAPTFHLAPLLGRGSTGVAVLGTF